MKFYGLSVHENGLEECHLAIEKTDQIDIGTMTRDDVLVHMNATMIAHRFKPATQVTRFVILYRRDVSNIRPEEVSATLDVEYR